MTQCYKPFHDKHVAILCFRIQANISQSLLIGVGVSRAVMVTSSVLPGTEGVFQERETQSVGLRGLVLL